MSDLPEDLLEEILSRVPATYLKRLRATCKRWNALLKDQGFKEKHFRKAPKQSQVLFGFKSRLKICSLSVNGCPSIEVTDEVRLTDPVYIYEQLEISKVFHCGGLLLFTKQKKGGLVVCNPCTRQARRIQPSDHHKISNTYTLGSFQDIKSNNISYKILRCDDYYEDKIRFEVYEFGSNSWRILDNTRAYKLTRYSDNAVSLRGKTYWVSWDRNERAMLLVSFDYTEERFGRMRLPYRSCFWTMSLSVVGEEKISLLLRRSDTSKREIWVTNKIDDWNKVLTMDAPSKRDKLVIGVSFLFDEEKNVFMCCERLHIPYLPGISVVGVGEDKKDKQVGRVYVVGEDKEAKQVNGEAIDVVYSYVPSLVHIPEFSQKRKSGD